MKIPSEKHGVGAQAAPCHLIIYEPEIFPVAGISFGWVVGNDKIK
jgi:hypothetical protein